MEIGESDFSELDSSLGIPVPKLHLEPLRLRDRLRPHAMR